MKEKLTDEQKAEKKAARKIRNDNRRRTVISVLDTTTTVAIGVSAISMAICIGVLVFGGNDS